MWHPHLFPRIARTFAGHSRRARDERRDGGRGGTQERRRSITLLSSDEEGDAAEEPKHELESELAEEEPLGASLFWLR